MTKYFFCYQKGIGDKWSPILYHREMPAVKDGYLMSANGQLCQVTRPVVIEQDAEPSFGFLEKKYPPPQKEVEMPRPVEGFKTNDGKFFETEDEAIIHEATSELAENFYKLVSTTDFVGLTAPMQDQIVAHALRFLYENREAVRRYIDAKKRISTEELRSDGSDAEGVS